MSSAIVRTDASWPATLPFEVALGVHSLDEILTSHGLDTDDWEILTRNTSFRKELIAAQKEVAETGLSFQRKAAIQAEMYLSDIDALMCGSETAPSIKLEIFKTLAKYGNLEPAPAKEQDNASTFNIQINF